MVGCGAGIVRRRTEKASNDLIDEVRIYNRALTEGKIRSLMLGYEPGEF